MPERTQSHRPFAIASSGDAASDDLLGRPSHVPPDRPTRRVAAGVVCAIDDDEMATHVVAAARSLANQLDLELTIVHSAHPHPFLVDEARAAAFARGHALLNRVAGSRDAHERVVDVGVPGRLILRVARAEAALIVMGGGRLGSQGEVLDAVLRGATCPVVVVTPTSSAATVTTSIGADRVPEHRRPGSVGERPTRAPRRPSPPAGARRRGRDVIDRRARESLEGFLGSLAATRAAMM